MSTSAEPEPAPRASWDGLEYEKVSALQRRVGAAFVDSLDLERPASILDVGCGDGFLTEQIAGRSHAEVVGVDSSAAMIGRADARASARLRFTQAEATSMHFDSSFDLVVSMNALHWVVDLTEAFRRMRAAQVAGGRLACQLVGASEAESVEDVTTRVTESGGWQEYFGESFHPYVHPTPAELRQVAEAGGYRVETCAAWNDVFVFPSAAHFEAWCAAGMSVWTNRLPLELRAQFVHEVATRYAQSSGSANEFHFGQVRLHASVPEG